VTADDNDNNIGLLVGGVIGGLAVMLGGIAMIVYVCKKTRAGSETLLNVATVGHAVGVPSAVTNAPSPSSASVRKDHSGFV
jgi:hypothetical protein